MKKLLILLTTCFSVGLFSCEKDDTNRWDYSAEAYLKDSTLYITKLVSLWQDNIVPARLNDIIDSVKVRNLTQSYKNAEDVLENLIALTPKDPSTGKPYDRFSFLDRQSVVADEIQNAQSTSFGMYLFYLQTEESKNDKNNAYLHVRMVDLNSPAYLAGIRRGDRILSINGNSNYDYNTQIKQDFNMLYNALSLPSLTIKFKKPSGEEIEKHIAQTMYSINPIQTYWTKQVDDKKVGYLAFSSFVSITDDKNNLTPLYNQLANVFSDFQKENIKHLIIDLRYNGGGATTTAEYMANTIVPASASGKRMYYYKINKFLEEDMGEYFSPVNFLKNGSLELTKVYFLVSSSTASASELVINSLKPYMDVQVIGSENTYGKPVGFWGIPIGKEKAKADIYVTSFQMFNANNYGDYFNGLAPNKLVNEDYFKDFGDMNEGFIAEALYHIKNGSYSTSTKSALSLKDYNRVTQSINLKNINYRASDIGMFKFSNQKVKFKDSY